jgi:ABC-type antimicrobial peptide transport system permease subunit
VRPHPPTPTVASWVWWPTYGINPQSRRTASSCTTRSPSGRWAAATTVVRVNGDTDAMAGTIRRTIETSEPTLAVAAVKTMERRVDESLWQRRLWGVLFSGFAVLALALAAVGLYGVTSYTVTQRTREIGIRMALGDRPLRMGRTVVREGMNLVGVGLVVGAVAAFGAGRLIEGLLFGVRPHDLVTFVTVVAVLTAAALAAIVIPAYRAAHVEPIVALRTE